MLGLVFFLKNFFDVSNHTAIPVPEHLNQVFGIGIVLIHVDGHGICDFFNVCCAIVIMRSQFLVFFQKMSCYFLQLSHFFT